MKNPMMSTTVRLMCASIILSLLAWIAAATQTPAVLPADKTAKIEAAVKALMSRQNIPGLSIAIVTDHQLRWAEGATALADVENSVPAKATTGVSSRVGRQTNDCHRSHAIGGKGQTRPGRSDSKIRSHLPDQTVANNHPSIARTLERYQELQRKRKRQHPFLQQPD